MLDNTLSRFDGLSSVWCNASLCQLDFAFLTPEQGAKLLQSFPQEVGHAPQVYFG